MKNKYYILSGTVLLLGFLIISLFENVVSLKDTNLYNSIFTNRNMSSEGKNYEIENGKKYEHDNRQNSETNIKETDIRKRYEKLISQLNRTANIEKGDCSMSSEGWYCPENPGWRDRNILENLIKFADEYSETDEGKLSKIQAAAIMSYKDSGMIDIETALQYYQELENENKTTFIGVLAAKQRVMLEARIKGEYRERALSRIEYIIQMYEDLSEEEKNKYREHSIKDNACKFKEILLHNKYMILCWEGKYAEALNMANSIRDDYSKCRRISLLRLNLPLLQRGECPVGDPDYSRYLDQN